MERATYAGLYPKTLHFYTSGLYNSDWTLSHFYPDITFMVYREWIKVGELI